MSRTCTVLTRTFHLQVRLMLKKGQEDGTDNDITPEQIDKIVALTDGYSNSDLASLVREAAAEPMREAMQVRLPTCELRIANVAVV